MRSSTPATWEVWRDLQTTTASQHCKLNIYFPQACRAYSRSTSLPSSLLGFHSLQQLTSLPLTPAAANITSCPTLDSVSGDHVPSASSESSVGTPHTGAWLTWSGNSLQSTYIAASGSLWLSQFHWLGHTKLQFACNSPPQPQQNQKSFWLGQAAG